MVHHHSSPAVENKDHRSRAGVRFKVNVNTDSNAVGLTSILDRGQFVTFIVMDGRAGGGGSSDSAAGGGDEGKSVAGVGAQRSTARCRRQRQRQIIPR